MNVTCERYGNSAVEDGEFEASALYFTPSAIDFSLVFALIDVKTLDQSHLTNFRTVAIFKRAEPFK